MLIRRLTGFAAALLLAVIAFGAVQTAQTASGWEARYYKNVDLNGLPVLERTDKAINFNWGQDSPGDGVPEDGFSVRWERSFNIPRTGAYELRARSDDGMRVYIDGELIIDNWEVQEPTTVTAEVNLTKGTQIDVVVEYFDIVGNAVAKASGSYVGSGGGGDGDDGSDDQWRARFYDNQSLSGSVEETEFYDDLDFDWDDDAPVNDVDNDNFSIEFTRTVYFEEALFDFRLRANDGARLYLNDQRVINDWEDGTSDSTVRVEVVSAGLVDIEVHFYDDTGDAFVELDWDRVGSGGGGDDDVPSGVEAVVDDGSSGFQYGGLFSDWNPFTDGYDGDAAWSLNSGAAIGDYNWARWYPSLSEAGDYEVLAYIPPSNATTTNARYWILADGMWHLAEVDQSANQGELVSLGTYAFGTSDASNYVSLSDVTFEEWRTTRVAWDVIVWVEQ